MKLVSWCTPVRRIPLSAGLRVERPDSQLSEWTPAAPRGPYWLKSCSSLMTDGRSPAETHSEVLEKCKEELNKLSEEVKNFRKHFFTHAAEMSQDICLDVLL